MSRIKLAAFWLMVCLILVSPLAVQASGDDFAWTGLVQVVGGQSGIWKIGGLSAQANTATLIDTGLVVGSCAKVEYHLNSSGLNLATKIEREPAYRCNTAGSSPTVATKLYATLNSFPAGLIGNWVIGGVTYTANNNTQFKETDGTFSVGRCVGVEYTAAKVALEIETEPNYKCTNTGAGLIPGVVYNRVHRILVTFPAGLLGTWTVVDSVTPNYNATGATRFEQEHGPFFNGACIEIKYKPNTINAAEISTSGADDCSSSGGDEPESKTYGLISAVPPGNIGSWTIGGFTFTSDINTDFRQDHGNFAPGVCAEVEYYPQSNNLAKKIATEEAYHCSTGTETNAVYDFATTVPVGLYGTWIIGDNSYYADGTTQFKGTFGGGVCVQVEYYVQQGVYHATEIEREDNNRCSGSPTLPGDSKVYATITSFPPTPYTGGWNIGGITFQAVTATQFEQNDGAFANGACVKANYVVVSNVRNLSQVETEPAYKCGNGTQFSGYGQVETFPAGLVGSWQISGITYNASPTTQFKQKYGFFSQGAYVEVKFTSTGNVLSIETHVAPGAGLSTITGRLDDRPNDDWGNWVIDGVTYQSDRSIEVDDSRTSSFSAAAVEKPFVTINGYRLNGETYITSVILLRSVYMPLIRK